MSPALWGLAVGRLVRTLEVLVQVAAVVHLAMLEILPALVDIPCPWATTLVVMSRSFLQKNHTVFRLESALTSLLRHMLR